MRLRIDWWHAAAYALAMQLFLDSADLNEVRALAASGVVDGVTTNPTLIARGGQPLEPTIEAICRMVHGPVSAEVLEPTCEGMLQEARALAALHPHVVVKVPLTLPGLGCVRQLHAEGIRTNVTLCFSVGQGLLAARAGATYVSPFVGRLDDVGQDGMQLVRDLVAVFARHRLATQVLAASIRSTEHVVAAALAGAHAATLPGKFFHQLVHHPLTDAGVAQFLRDAGRTA